MADIEAVVHQIVERFNPQRIILFGSYAWGNPHQDSDLDFLIIKKTDDPMLKRIVDVDRLFLRRDFAMDFLVYTPDQVKKRKEMGDQFVANILNKGKLLYAK